MFECAKKRRRRRQSLPLHSEVVIGREETIDGVERVYRDSSLLHLSKGTQLSAVAPHFHSRESYPKAGIQPRSPVHTEMTAASSAAVAALTDSLGQRRNSRVLGPTWRTPASVSTSSYGLWQQQAEWTAVSPYPCPLRLRLLFRGYLWRTSTSGREERETSGEETWARQEEMYGRNQR